MENLLLFLVTQQNVAVGVAPKVSFRVQTRFGPLKSCAGSILCSYLCSVSSSVQRKFVRLFLEAIQRIRELRAKLEEEADEGTPLICVCPCL
jgi:phage terminase Nu1 subunit (DNA packaging protein)